MNECFSCREGGRGEPCEGKYGSLVAPLAKGFNFRKTCRKILLNPSPFYPRSFHAPLIASFLDTNDAPFIWQLRSSGSHLLRLLIASPSISNFPSIYNFSSAIYYSNMHKLDETRGKGNKVRLFDSRPSTYFIGRTLIFISIPTTCTAYFSMIYFFHTVKPLLLLFQRVQWNSIPPPTFHSFPFFPLLSFFRSLSLLFPSCLRVQDASN